MKIKWLGHAAFLITTDSGIRIITDPYTPNEKLTYEEINEPADIVTVSHEHGDHNNVAAISGNPEVLRGSAEVKGISFRGISAFHDAAQGSQRGHNTIFCFEVDGLKTCHLGDLGHPLSDRQVTEIGAVDVLMIPVGGSYTVDSGTAHQVIKQLKPKVAIPMHFKNDRCNFPLDGVAGFTRGQPDVRETKSTEAEFHPSSLPTATRIVVLQPAR